MGTFLKSSQGDILTESRQQIVVFRRIKLETSLKEVRVLDAKTKE